MRWAFSPLSSRSWVAASIKLQCMERGGRDARRAADSRAVDRRGRRVLELLLGAEEGVEDCLAGVLAEDQGDSGADQAEQDDAAKAALLALLRRPECLRGVTQVLCGRL